MDWGNTANYDTVIVPISITEYSVPDDIVFLTTSWMNGEISDFEFMKKMKELIE